MNKKVTILKIKAGMSDPKGQLIPRGVREQLTIEISDEVAVYYFKDRKVTKNFATVEIEGDKAKGKPQKTFFMERTGKAIVKYDGKKKEEIRDIILKQLNEMGLNANTNKK